MYSESAPPAPAAPSAFSLRPLSTGEVLDRSFALFRSSFLLCVGVSMVPAIFLVLQTAVRIAYIRVAHLSPLTGSFATAGLATVSIIFSLLSFFVFGWAGAALCWVLGRSYLGRGASIRSAYSTVLSHWFRYPAVLVLQILRAGWLTILLFAVAGGLLGYASTQGAALGYRLIASSIVLLAGLSVFLSLFLYIRLALAMPVAVLEDQPALAALRRSKALLTTRKGRVFGVMLVIGLLYLVLGSITGAVGVMFVRGRLGLYIVQGVALLVSFASTLLLQPIFQAAMCILYYDERVRNEGYDLTFLMEEADSATLAQPQSVPAASVPGSAAF